MTNTLWISNFVGNTYYVATAGDDDNLGVDPSAPWKTIAKVNAATLLPGDHVLFNGGDTFVGSLYPPANGTAAAPITFGTYGIGRAKIDGSADSSGAMVILAAARYYLRFEHLWFYGGPNTTGYAPCQYNSHDGYFYDCEVSNSGTAHNGFAAYSATGSIIYNITLDSCIFHDNNKSGCYVGSDDGTVGPHDVILQSCISYSNGVALSHHGYYLDYGTTAYDCIAYSNYDAGFKFNNNSIPSSIGLAPKIYRCTSYSNGQGFYFGADHVLMVNCLGYGNLNYSIQFDADGDNCELYFNTLSNETSATNRAIGFASSTGCTGNILKYNCFIQDTAVVTKGFILTNGTLADLAANNTFDDNYYFGNFAATNTKFAYDTDVRSWNTWRACAAAPDANSTFSTTVPDIATPYTDYHALDGGDLEGTALYDAAITTTDKAGVARSNPTACGCYEAVT